MRVDDIARLVRTIVNDRDIAMHPGELAIVLSVKHQDVDLCLRCGYYDEHHGTYTILFFNGGIAHDICCYRLEVVDD